MMKDFAEDVDMTLEINLPNKTVIMLSVKEMKDFPLIKCKCGTEFAPLDDTYVGDTSYCVQCRIKIYDSKLNIKGSEKENGC